MTATYMPDHLSDFNYDHNITIIALFFLQRRLAYNAATRYVCVDIACAASKFQSKVLAFLNAEESGNHARTDLTEIVLHSTSVQARSDLL